MAVLNSGIYPATYQPYVQYVQQYQQPQFQSTAMVPAAQSNQQQTPVMSQNSIVWINDERDALSYPIAPNNAVALWEISGKRIYVKSADATGKPTIKTYDLVEHVDAEVVDNPKELPYAMKDDLSAVVAALKELSGVVSSIRGDVDGMKNDFYGVVGKKKVAKKTEALDDDE